MEVVMRLSSHTTTPEQMASPSWIGEDKRSRFGIHTDSKRLRSFDDSFGWKSQVTGTRTSGQGMNSSAPVRKAAAKKSSSARVAAEMESGPDCSFCWFVLTLYPALTGMTDEDARTYKDHLKQAHGLGKEIQP